MWLDQMNNAQLMLRRDRPLKPTTVALPKQGDTQEGTRKFIQHGFDPVVPFSSCVKTSSMAAELGRFVFTSVDGVEPLTTEIMHEPSERL